LKRITTEPILIPLRISGPLAGQTAPSTAQELNIFEISEEALKIAKQTYSLFWNMQYALQDVNALLGGNPVLASNAENLTLDTYESISKTELQYSENGLPIQDGNGNYIFAEENNGKI
jgi:hypothetical protein